MRWTSSLDHVFALVVAEVVFTPQPAGGAGDLDQARGRLRFCRLTTPFRPVDPLCFAHGGLPVTNKCAVRLAKDI